MYIGSSLHFFPANELPHASLGLFMVLLLDFFKKKKSYGEIHAIFIVETAPDVKASRLPGVNFNPSCRRKGDVSI